MREHVGWVGLGKLGLPCALVMAQHHQVTGYDVSDLPDKILYGKEEPPREEGIKELLEKHSLTIAHSVDDVVSNSDVIFVAVQTPHSPEYGGETPAPGERRDFEYAYLVQTVRNICLAAKAQRKNIIVAVISTVLPGTCSRLIFPMLNRYVQFAYTPAFIAMGTTIADYRKPEFQVCGVLGEAKKVRAQIARVFLPVHGEDRLLHCGVEDGEAIKIVYNTLISTKIVFANMLMEMCHKTGADCDVVTGALALATDRLISDKYLYGGMGDGGACHPRDLIAMSWLAERLDLSYDLMGSLVQAREAQVHWIADLATQYKELSGLPLTILGKSYKPKSAITTGSPALLLADQLRGESPWQYDPYVDEPHDRYTRLACVFVIATAHPEFYDLEFAYGSIVIDPWGRMKDQPGVTVIRVGRKT